MLSQFLAKTQSDETNLHFELLTFLPLEYVVILFMYERHYQINEQHIKYVPMC